MVEKEFKIIIVDDDEKIIDVLKAKLNRYTAEGYTNPSEAIERIRKEKFDLLILDYLLVGTTGDEVIERIREFDKELCIFLLTGYDKKTASPLKTLHEMDIQYYCEKGPNIEKILASIEGAIKILEFAKVKEVDFAERLRALRRNRKVEQDELAQYVGVGRTAVSNWESGTAKPSYENLKKIATFFRVTIDYLLGYQIDYSKE